MYSILPNGQNRTTWAPPPNKTPVHAKFPTCYTVKMLLTPLSNLSRLRQVVAKMTITSVGTGGGKFRISTHIHFNTPFSLCFTKSREKEKMIKITWLDSTRLGPILKWLGLDSTREKAWLAQPWINVLLITRDKGQVNIFRIFNDKISCRFSLSLSFVVLVNLWSIVFFSLHNYTI
jgi:hypothetical protein